MPLILPAATIGAAAAGVLSQTYDLGNSRAPLIMTGIAKFLYGAGGTTVKAWLQSSYDNVAWFDVKNFAFTTAPLTKLGSLIPAAVASAVLTDATLADDLKIDGVFGRFWRVKYTSTGTYTGATSLEVGLYGTG